MLNVFNSVFTWGFRGSVLKGQGFLFNFTGASFT